jgi:hypothetical protein
MHVYAIPMRFLCDSYALSMRFLYRFATRFCLNTCRFPREFMEHNARRKKTTSEAGASTIRLCNGATERPSVRSHAESP